jgi:hypothetical protein
VFGHPEDEFHAGRSFDSFDGFEQGLDDYIVHWNTRGRQQRPSGRTPIEFRG